MRCMCLTRGMIWPHLMVGLRAKTHSVTMASPSKHLGKLLHIIHKTESKSKGSFDSLMRRRVHLAFTLASICGITGLVGCLFCERILHCWRHLYGSHIRRFQNGMRAVLPLSVLFKHQPCGSHISQVAQVVPHDPSSAVSFRENQTVRVYPVPPPPPAATSASEAMPNQLIPN